MKGTRINVLDHGFVELLDYMGTDEDIVNAARESCQEGTKVVSTTRNLIRFMMRHKHTTPFEMAVLKFRVKLPIVVERQWIRHRTFSTNEMSGRHSVLPDQAYLPSPDRVRLQSQKNKQGSGEAANDEVTETFLNGLQDTYDQGFRAYHEALNDDVAREIARFNVPITTYTSKVWCGNLHNLLHFLELRIDAEHPQWEIRQYALAMSEIVKELFPLTWEAFQDYRLDAVTFSGPELKYIDGAIKGYGERLPDLSDREKWEFRAKIDKVWQAQRAKEQKWASAGSQS